jgi:thiol-disulfide isomerase/thioredoxin
MKSFFTTFAVRAAFAVLSTSLANAESVSEISKRFAADKAKALEAYLQANPKAADTAEANDLLADSYAETGDTKKQLAALNNQYAAMPKGALGDLRAAAMNLSKRAKLFTDKAQAKAAVEGVRKDFAEHGDIEKASQFFDGMLKKLELPGIGDEMKIAFTALDGSKVDTTSMKGKVVLVDFWATWCGPCVGELPNVKKAFEAYHGKGFEIVGISLDQDKGKLESFIHEKGVTWPQGFDGKGWENELAQKFGIQSIPATFLIGKDGKIADTDLRGPALEEKLAELLK